MAACTAAFQCAKEALRDSVLPSLAHQSAQHSLAVGNMDEVPLGFQTGGELAGPLRTYN
jgi:hypothetical protein